MTKLFQPIKLRGLEVRNRIWIAPMCQYSCENQDGLANDWHLVHLGSRASGGAGMVIAEATAVEPIGRITPWDTGIWNDEQVVGWRRVTDFIRSQGAASAIQLAHAGRKAGIHREWSGSGSVALEDGGWQTVSSTAEPFDSYASPRSLETFEVEAMVELWAQAAERSVQAGFDAIEIHAAHGYLIHQFLSPLTNQRTDEYGGSLENRARLLLQIVAAIRKVIPTEMPLMIRFSASDWTEGGWDESQTSQVAKWAEELGVDFFDISSGGLVMAKIPFGPGYQVPLAEFVAERVGEPVSAVGLITQAEQAEQVLEQGDIAVVMIARASLRDPYWPLRAAFELGVEIDYWPKQYSRGKWS
jgi:2,4-dienoyl-CoA reductase-like NADH-dependent reductase (Old Yellow Enzyme family)